MSIRPMEMRDVPSVLEIQSECLEIAQWTDRDYTRVVQGEMAGWVAEEKDEVAGFIIARQVATDVEILNLAVRPELRKRGIGGSLLRGTLAWAAAFQTEKAFLEVRASNIAALRFYEDNHFQATGRRPRYYSAPVEDALVLTAPVRSL